MKIAILHYYQGSVDRGAETFVYHLAKKLAKNSNLVVFQGGEVNLKLPFKAVQKHPDQGKYPDDDLPVAHILKRLFLDSRKQAELAFTFKCLPDLVNFRPDIVIPLNSGWQALIISLLSRFIGAKTVIPGESGPGWNDRWNLWVKPHVFVSLTDRQKKWAQKASLWKSTQIVKIPNGVDLDQFNPAGKKKKLALQKPITLLVGATIPSKRVEQGIVAVARLDKGSLLLLGTGPGDKRVDKLGYKLLGKERFLHLSVSHHDMPAYYRSSDLFTLCSASSEAFGIVYLEALASGLPCVVTDDASRREIVGKSGVFVKDPDNENEYSQAISQALKKNWGQLSLKQAQKFSWDKISKKYLLLFKNLI